MIPILLAQLLDASRLICGSDGSLHERLEAIDARRPAAPHRAAATDTPVLISGVVVLKPNDQNAPFDHPFDLGGSTLRFERRDAESWTVSRGPVVIDPGYGEPLDVQENDRSSGPVMLPFEFPFYGASATEIFVTPYNAIYLEEPLPGTALLQMSDLDLAAGRDAIIAPMLTTESLQFLEYPDVFVKSAGDFVRVTWRREGFWRYLVQATITAAGDVTFSYDVEIAPYAAALVIRPGPFDGAPAVLGEARDATGDSEEPMLDIVSASMSRVGDSNLLRFRIETAAPFSTGGLGASEWMAWSVSVTEPALMLRIYGDGRNRYTIPGWGIVALPSPAARVEGREIILEVLDEHLAIEPGSHSIEVRTWRGTSVADAVTLAAAVHPPSRSVAIEASSIESGTVLSGPILEAFTLPVLNVHAVWRQLRAAWPVDGSTVDAVAIYPDFRTDIILFASAYSSGGNPGVDNIIESKPFVASHLERTPALMHMNMLGNGTNRNGRFAAQNLMHELGHRWLYDVSILENGSSSRVLNPAGGHPAQYVHTPAAFAVTSSGDSSVMGGGTFTEVMPGSYASWATRSSYGYSWTDLYLMGLASPAEVEPWFYLANSDPPLGPSYYPPAGRTYSATRREVTIDQMVGAMGERQPQYPDTQREFRVMFVLLTPGGAAQGEIDQMGMIRREFEQSFREATGNRGRVQTGFSGTPPPRRRSVSR
ncbi:MAG TPA: hypothetical protein VMS98_05445 [Thermoanaerobaculia bacterium]|nr:hypothetical protein [Thermoanaerobaculia bacterium]